MPINYLLKQLMLKIIILELLELCHMLILKLKKLIA